MTELYIQVLPCSRNPIPQTCLPLSDFQGIQIVISTAQVLFDPSNSKNPIDFIASSELLINLDPKIRQDRTIFFKSVEIYDDKQDFFDEVFKVSYNDIDKSDVQSSFRDLVDPLCNTVPLNEGCAPYLQILVKTGNKIITIKRIYSKIFTTLGELGGFLDIFMLMVTFVYMIIHWKRDIAQIKRSLLGINYLENRAMFTNSANVVFADKKKARERDDKLLEIEEDIIEESVDGILLAKKALEVEVLNGLILKDYHRSLLPVIYMHKAKKRLEAEKVEKVAADLIKKSLGANNNLGNIFKVKKSNDSLNEKELVSAYSKFLEEQPKNDLEVMIKEYFVANLPEEFKKNIIKETQTDIGDNSDVLDILIRDSKKLIVDADAKSALVLMKKDSKNDKNKEIDQQPCNFFEDNY